MIRCLRNFQALSLLIASCASVLLTQQSFCKDVAQVPTLPMPAAPAPAPDQVIIPPQQNAYFPMRADGQPFVLNEDWTVNLTDWLNHYYFNPSWRGEEWAPYQNYWIVERQCRSMALWSEYDEFTTFRFAWPTNRIHKWFEKYSGYGP